MIALVQKIPLFKTLTLEKLHFISSKVVTLKYDSNEIVFSSGELGDALYIIKNGSVVVIDTDDDGDEIILSKLSAGNYFGEMALLTGDNRSATIKTLSKSILLKFSKDDFQFLLNENIAMYIPISHVLSQRLRTANKKRLHENLKLKQHYAPSGQLSKVSVNTILKQCEENGLNGRVILRQDKNKGILSYVRGDITCISLNGLNNPDFLNDILMWENGYFKIDPLPFSFEQKAVVKKDTAEIPELKKMTLENLINILNLISQYAVQIIGKTIIESLLKRIQKILYKNHPELYIFVVNGVFIDLYKQSGDREVKDDELVAVALWIRSLINECSHYELRFETFDIKKITHTYRDLLQHSGFYDYYLVADDY